MKEITDEEYELFQKLKKIWVHSVPEKSGLYFICGEGGDKDAMGLPDKILVCPTYGVNITAVYEKKQTFRSGQ